MVVNLNAVGDPAYDVSFLNVDATAGRGQLVQLDGIKGDPTETILLREHAREGGCPKEVESASFSNAVLNEANTDLPELEKMFRDMLRKPEDLCGLGHTKGFLFLYELFTSRFKPPAVDERDTRAKDPPIDQHALASLLACLYADTGFVEEKEKKKEEGDEEGAEQIDPETVKQLEVQQLDRKSTRLNSSH